MDTIWHSVATFPLEKNLQPFLSQLQQRGITHYVTEEEGRQQLWIKEKHRITEVIRLSSQWNSGRLNIEAAHDDHSEEPVHHDLWIVYLLRAFPVSTLTILLGLCGALLIHLDPQRFTYAHGLLFQPLANGTLLPLSTMLELGQYWRLLTPIFLHFGIFHILFNGSILWAMGTRIERAKGSLHYLLLILTVGVISNIAQYLWQSNTIFGGLSGVVYGVIGYIAVYQIFIAHRLLRFNHAVIIFFIIWLLLGFTGVIDLFIPGRVANMSHLAGFIVGAATGYLIALKDK